MIPSSNHSLAEWLNYIESIHPAEIDMGLDRVRQVAQRLNLLSPNAKVITVAGTNGKGSCVACLESLLRAAGLRCGSYSSPHFLRYNERIKIDGHNAEDQQIVDAFAAIEIARKQQAEISLSYFEFGTLAALQVFSQLPLDVFILEVGLGGRLDAVNIIDPDVAIITSIALDHEDWLGSDLGLIGREKAGIFRSNRWAVCADTHAPESIKDYAGEISAKLLWVGEEFTFALEEGRILLQLNEGSGQKISAQAAELPLNSQAAALCALALLNYLPEPNKLRAALANTRLAGRGQKAMLGDVPVLLDVAHNPAAVQRLASQLRHTRVDAGHRGCILVVSAMMADKDCAGVLSHLLDVADEFYVCDLIGNARAAKASELAELLQVQGAEVQCFNSVAMALAKAQNSLSGDDLILVMGSFFTVSDAMSALGLSV